MNNKAKIYWVMTMLVLIPCLFVSVHFNHSGFAPINLSSKLKVEPRFLYRQDNHFHAVVIGQLRIDINTTAIDTDFAKYDQIAISNLSYEPNTQITLNWTINDQPHKQAINLARQSLTTIDFKTTDANQIKDLHFILQQSSTMGTNHSFQTDVVFNTIELTHTKAKAINFSDFNQWLSYHPLSFTSINSYTNDTQSIYKPVIMRLSIWLCFCLLLFYYLNINKKHVILSASVAWLCLLGLHINNRLSQYQQINQAFPNNTTVINSTDQDALQLAQSIEQGLKKVNHTQAIIVGARDFANLRLLFHLREHNLALNTNLIEMLADSRLHDFVFIVLNNGTITCATISSDPNYNALGRVAHLTNDYCLVVQA